MIQDCDTLDLIWLSATGETAPAILQHLLKHVRACQDWKLIKQSRHAIEPYPIILSHLLWIPPLNDYVNLVRLINNHTGSKVLSDTSSHRISYSFDYVAYDAANASF